MKRGSDVRLYVLPLKRTSFLFLLSFQSTVLILLYRTIVNTKGRMETTNNTVNLKIRYHYFLEFAMRLITDHGGGSSFEPVVDSFSTLLLVVCSFACKTKNLEHNILLVAVTSLTKAKAKAKIQFPT